MIIGPVGRSAFTRPEERQAAYFRHREEILALVTPDTKPWAWVEYEGGGFETEDGQRISKALARLAIKTTEGQS